MDDLLAGRYTALVVVGVVVACIFAVSKLRVTLDPQEPPLVKSRVPFIGHILGAITGRMNYIGGLGLKHPDLPIFTLPMGSEKIYYISSPQLIQAIYRNKAFSFEPLTVAFADKVVGYGPNLNQLLRHPPTDGSISWLNDQHKRYDVLSLGPGLYAMNVRVLESLSGVLNQLGSAFETKQLYLWLRDTFSVATTAALFGLDNPLIQDPTLLKNLWDFETAQESFAMHPFPSITLRKAYLARRKLQESLRVYFRKGYDESSDVSSIIKQRAATNRKWGVPIDDIADHELGMLFVAVTNSIPIMFWMVAYIFRDPQLIADLQQELLKIVKETEHADGKPRECTFDVSTFSTSAPLLNAVYNEVLRLQGRQMGSRTVMQDVVLNYSPTDGGESRGYLLKKGATLLMPALTTHYSEATWGQDVHAFNPRRFLDRTREEERSQNRALNPFGGGKHLCPGRHFAYAEILGAVAVLVLGYVIETPEGGNISVPPSNNNLAEAVVKPLQKDQEGMLARIKRRPGWEDVQWGFVVAKGASP
ncbi:cytochrome P450 [Xylariales sp. PMI_506]|nr:cytochrome P450 [Xylariales sp. PMI_506]